MAKQAGKIAFKRGLIYSQAYLRLTGMVPQVLGLFYSKRCFKRVRKDYICVNAREIIFTYSEAEKLGISADRFKRAVDQLVRHGFLDIVHLGGGMLGNATIYGLSKRWEKYGTEQFEKVERPRDNRRLGFQNPEKNIKGRSTINADRKKKKEKSQHE